MPHNQKGYIREVLLGAVIAALGAILLKYADLPVRVSVVETKTTGLEQRLASMDTKLDAILGKIGR
jgi:hypothetical protein